MVGVSGKDVVSTDIPLPALPKASEDDKLFDNF